MGPVTKKELIIKAIQECGEPFCQKTVQKRLNDQGMHTSPVYIYSIKREMDGLPPYDQRGLIEVDGKPRTKTKIANELLDENPNLTAEELYEKLTAMGITANVKHLQRLVGSRHKTIDYVIINLAERMGGFGVLKSVVDSVEKKQSA